MKLSSEIVLKPFRNSRYCKTLKRRVSALTREENEITITKVEYEILKSQRDKKLKIIHKKRYWFCYKHQYFSLDVFQSPRKLYLLEIELAEERDRVSLPDFLEVVREVTEDPKFSNSNIATR